MRVLLITPDFPPVLNSAARLYHELAEELQQHGFQVTVLTRIPSRYLADGEQRHRVRFVLKEDMKGIQVWRLKNLPVPLLLPMARALEHFWMALMFLIGGLGLPKQDAIILYSPPLPMGLTGYLLARRWGGAVIVNVQDLYPQTVVDLGLLRNRFFIRLAEKIETFIYRRVDAITVHSEGNRDYIIRKQAYAGHIHIIPNWVDLKLIQPGPRDNGWRHFHGLDKAFIVSFAGTMGFAQGLEDVVEAADRLKQFPEIVFVLAGDGVYRNTLQKKTSDKRLENIRFLPPQSADAYLELLQASDVCLVTLHKDLKTPVVPGKLQSVMAAGRPLIFCANPANYTKRLIEEAGCGFFVPAGDTINLAGAVLTLYNSRELVEQMGRQGRYYAEKHFERKKCTQAYAHLLSTLDSQRRNLS